LVGEARKLETPVHGVCAHAVEQHDRRRRGAAGFHVAPAVAEEPVAGSGGDLDEFQFGKGRKLGFHLGIGGEEGHHRKRGERESLHGIHWIFLFVRSGKSNSS
jgi:hypothetical protein